MELVKFDGKSKQNPTFRTRSILFSLENIRNIKDFSNIQFYMNV